MRTRSSRTAPCVPPVTAERSPPVSRMTGADSPVMADSSTEAMPSITSPSPGITSPASTSDDVAGLQLVGAGPPDSSGRRPSAMQLGAASRCACLRKRVGLRLAAPLGHGLGEVGEQHGEPQPEDDLELEADMRRRR